MTAYLPPHLQLLTMVKMINPLVQRIDADPSSEFFFPHLFSALTTTALPLPPASMTIAAPLGPLSLPYFITNYHCNSTPCIHDGGHHQPQDKHRLGRTTEMDALRKVYHRAEKNYGLCILLFIAINYSDLCRLKKSCLICLYHICKFKQSSAWEENNPTGVCSNSRLDADTY